LRNFQANAALSADQVSNETTASKIPSGQMRWTHKWGDWNGMGSESSRRLYYNFPSKANTN